VEAGLTSFDMADHYGPAEVVAGRFHSRAPHLPLQLLTKWVPKPGRLSKADVRAAVDLALKRLRVDTIDLLQFHAWNYADPAWLETLFELQELKQQGLIRELGLTNVDTAHLRVVLASGIQIVSNQVSFSLLDQRAAHGLSAFCVDHGVQLLAYGTLAGGWLTERWLGAPEPDWDRVPTWSMMKYGRFLRVAGGWSALQRVLKAAASVAGRHGVSIPNVASRFIMDQPGVAGVGLDEERGTAGLVRVDAGPQEVSPARPGRHRVGMQEPHPGGPQADLIVEDPLDAVVLHVLLGDARPVPADEAGDGKGEAVQIDHADGGDAVAHRSNQLVQQGDDLLVHLLVGRRHVLRRAEAVVWHTADVEEAPEALNERALDLPVVRVKARNGPAGCICAGRSQVQRPFKLPAITVPGQGAVRRLRMGAAAALSHGTGRAGDGVGLLPELLGRPVFTLICRAVDNLFALTGIISPPSESRLHSVMSFIWGI
jgi:aryl-alcohol dehydrogenase-like predicted oxidoreductase